LYLQVLSAAVVQPVGLAGAAQRVVKAEAGLQVLWGDVCVGKKASNGSCSSTECLQGSRMGQGEGNKP